MKHKLILGILLLCISQIGCVSDGVEYDKDYTDSENIVNAPDNNADNTQKAQYHFELTLKKAVLDKDIVGDWEGAVKELDKAIELSPEFQKAYHYRAILHSTLQQKEQAMKDIDKAIELDNKSVESYFVRAGLFAEQGNFKNTVAELDVIISLDPNNGKAYDRRGYAKIELGEKDSGCQDLNKARELGYMVENNTGDKLICN
ncbi:tetratricopeptide repeat protein [Putridiphycobacter roseus]|nr:hypothetical protein [Putridiphycobacter roseus]